MSFTIQLEEPIYHGQEEIKEVTFQTPRVKHLLEFDKEKGEMAGFVRFLAALSSLPPAVLGQMTMSDLGKAKAHFQDFLPEEKDEDKSFEAI